MVQVALGCIAPNVEKLENMFHLDHTDRIFVSSPPTFDPFVVDVFLALRNGACLILASNKVRLCADMLLKILFEQDKVTFMQITPSLFRRWSEESVEKVVLREGCSLRHLVLGGEPFPATFNVPSKSSVKIYNIYGVTEVSCWATIEKVCAGSSCQVALGSPLDDTIELQLRHFDTDEVVDLGQMTAPTRGQLYIGSRVRKCLVNDERPGDIFGSTTICFRQTGDSVELRPDGKFYYLGRCDEMVKRFGVRVSLVLLEQVADLFSGILKSYVAFNEFCHKFVLFYKANGESINEERFREYLRASLQQHQLPDELIRVDNFPLSKHGKINRSALLQQYMPLMTKNPCDMRQLFGENVFKLLGIHFEVDVPTQTKQAKFDHNISFLDAGGTSMQAVQLVTTLQDRSKIRIPNLIGLLLDKSVPMRDALSYLDSASGSNNISQKFCLQFPPSINISIETRFGMSKCIDASPTIYHSKVQNRRILSVGSHSHKVIVIDLHTDAVVSELTLPDRIESAVSYLMDGDYGLVGCYDGFLYCFNLWTTDVRWKFDSGGMIKCKALVVGSSIVFGSYSEKHNIFAVDTEGTCIWRLQLGTKGILSSPIDLGDGTAFVATLDGTYCCLAIKDGISKWSGNFNSPVFATATYAQQREVILVAEVQGVLHCLARRCGTKLWSLSTDGNLFSSPEVVSQKSSMDIIFGCHDKYLYCYDWINGGSDDAKLKWRIRLQSPIYSSPKVSSDLLVACSTSGYVNLVSMEDIELAGVIKLDGEVFSTPVIIDSNVYVGCRDNNLYKIGFHTSSGT